MTELSHFDFKGEFTVDEVAALIAGLDPNDPSAPIHRAKPVRDQLVAAYDLARKWCAGHPMTPEEFEDWRENLFPDKLLSVLLESYALLQKAPTPGEPHGDWDLPRLLGGERGEIEHQKFTRAELLRWLSAVGRNSKYRFQLNADPVTEDLAAARALTAPRPPEKRQRSQEEAILEALRSGGHDPKNLPPPAQKGGAGVKKETKELVLRARGDLFQSEGVFDKAWERLSQRKEVAWGVQCRAWLRGDQTRSASPAGPPAAANGQPGGP